MSSSTSLFLTFLTTLLLLLLHLPFSHGDFHYFQISPTPSSSGWESEKLWGKSPTMSFVEGPFMAPVEDYSSVVLAAERTRRKDPLDGLKLYTRGWNISDHHYWASVGYTAVPLFAIAVIWFLGFGLCLSIIFLCYFCCKQRRPYGYSRTAYALSLIFLALFTILAIIGCVVLYTGQEKFHHSTTMFSIFGMQLLPCDYWVDTSYWNLHSVWNIPSPPQSGPLVPLLCNPFHHDLSDRTCTAGEVWGSYVCQVSGSGTCTTTGRLTPTFYDQMSSGISMSIALNSYGPFLTDLQDCTFVRETFNDIYSDHCPSLRRYTKWIYIGLVMVSTAVMLSLVFWVIYGRERRQRLYATTTHDHSMPHPHVEIEKD
ncbi:hypothetical protein G4B88_013191 [Cannabis sativa]|uniref:Uncharacterized protein n=1 Tax=Cannabis sativa TaxID=3483 RepID=A0A7J6GZE1_CANSA|nr:hypothetical protein G4B88_013191 [Cannabis sativa]